MVTDLHDIGVLGSGPAALAVASACARRGASVTVVSPEPHSPWMPNYCLWADEVPLELQDLTEQFWPEVSVATVLGARVRQARHRSAAGALLGYARSRFCPRRAEMRDSFEP